METAMKDQTNNTTEDIRYTMSEFLNDITESLHNEAVNSSDNIEASRDLKYQIKVIQKLIDLDLPIFGNSNAETLCEEIRNKVENDDILFVYTFYVSSNHNFNYSWSYLRKKIDHYQDFLFEVHRFICSVLEDICIISSQRVNLKNLHFSFHDLIDVKITEDPPYVKSSLNRNSFHQLNNVKKGYLVSAKCEDTTLLSSYHQYDGSSIDSFLNNVVKISTSENN